MNNGGGWTVFQRRCDGSENFNRGWTEYENGFGNVKGEYWLGLKKISCLTRGPEKTKLRIELADFAGHSKFACYDHFHVGTPSTNYRLTIGGYQNWGIGTAGDSMTGFHSLNGMSFSTHDRDNDRSSSNCAVSQQGAWWYNSCHHSNLNGLYLSSQSATRGVTWRYFNATAPSWLTLRYSDMKLKRGGWTPNSLSLGTHRSHTPANLHVLLTTSIISLYIHQGACLLHCNKMQPYWHRVIPFSISINAICIIY